MSNLKPYYQDEYATIYHGDCREILPHLEAVDAVITDPPYNAKKDYGVFKDNLSAEEYESFMSQVVTDCLRLASKQFWVAPRYQMKLWLNLLPGAHQIVIRRGAAGPYRGGWSDQYATALSIGKPKRPCSDLWDDIRLKGEGYFFRENAFGHPGYTPSPIFERAISLFADTSIIDPFAGTGTSLFKAKQFGLKAIGIEINEKYCEIAAERLRQEVLAFA